MKCGDFNRIILSLLIVYTMRNIIIPVGLMASLFLMASCGGAPENNNGGNQPAGNDKPAAGSGSPESYDPKRGEGKYSPENLQLAGVDAAMAGKGEAISGTKCLSCHKTTEERLVGPGWKGVTERRTPHWIMNFITNPDPMIEKDPELQAQLELCLVRMPNQNLSDDDARQVLEFMRKNDGSK